VCGLAVEVCFAGLGAFQPQCDADESGLAAAIRACDPHELAASDVQVDIAENRGAAGVGEGDVSEGDR
jgi:hypothetical protein